MTVTFEQRSQPPSPEAPHLTLSQIKDALGALGAGTEVADPSASLANVAAKVNARMAEKAVGPVHRAPTPGTSPVRRGDTQILPVIRGADHEDPSEVYDKYGFPDVVLNYSDDFLNKGKEAAIAGKAERRQARRKRIRSIGAGIVRAAMFPARATSRLVQG